MNQLLESNLLTTKEHTHFASVAHSIKEREKFVFMGEWSDANEKRNENCSTIYCARQAFTITLTLRRGSMNKMRWRRQKWRKGRKKRERDKFTLYVLEFLLDSLLKNLHLRLLFLININAQKLCIILLKIATKIFWYLSVSKPFLKYNFFSLRFS